MRAFSAAIIEVRTETAIEPTHLLRPVVEYEELSQSISQDSKLASQASALVRAGQSKLTVPNSYKALRINRPRSVASWPVRSLLR